jgi:DNA excision repair protein ERCC-3
VDLPEATVAIQVSRKLGLGRKRPSASDDCCAEAERPPRQASTRWWYRDTVDQDFAQNRQRFLAEQGYSYTILDGDAIAA